MGMKSNNTKDQSSAGQTNWPRHKARISSLLSAQGEGNKNKRFLSNSFKDADSSDTNDASDNAHSTSPMFHMGNVGHRARLFNFSQTIKVWEKLNKP